MPLGSFRINALSAVVAAGGGGGGGGFTPTPENFANFTTLTLESSYTIATTSLITSIAWGDDGNSFYYLLNATDTLVQLSCSVPWSFSGTESQVGTRVFTEDTTPYAFAFNDTGSKLFMIGGTNDTVRRYSTTSAWAVANSGIDYAGGTIPVGTYSSVPYGMFLSADGTKLYHTGLTSSIRQWNLSSPYVLTGATYAGTSPGTNTGGSTIATPTSVYLDSTGTYLFVSGTGISVAMYTLSTPGNLTTATFTRNIANPNGTAPYGQCFKYDGTRMYIYTHGDKTVRSYNLS